MVIRAFFDVAEAIETLSLQVPNLNALTLVPPATEQIFGVSEEALTRERAATEIDMEAKILVIRDVVPMRMYRSRDEFSVVAPATEVEVLPMEAPGAKEFDPPVMTVVSDDGVVGVYDVLAVGPTESGSPKTLSASAVFEMAPSPSPSWLASFHPQHLTELFASRTQACS